MKKQDDFELNLAKLFIFLWKRLPIIMLVSILAAVAVFYLLRSPVETTYTAKVSFLVPRENTVIDRQVEHLEENDFSDESVSVGYFSSASVDTYSFVAIAPATLEYIAAQADLPYSAGELARMVSAAQEKNNVFTFAVLVNNSDKDEALRVAKAISGYLPEYIAEIAPGSSIRVLNSGSVSAQSSGGSDVKKTAIVAIATAFLAVCFYALLFVVKEYSGNNSVLTFELSRLYPKIKMLSLFSSECDDDAVKRLRSNLRMAFPESEQCRMIGLTAAHSDPGKDDLALRLTNSFAALGDRVLLVDADLRSNRLQGLTHSEQHPGLSELIRKTAAKSAALQEVKEDGCSFSFLSAGDGVAEASELLDPRKLFPVLRDLQQEYDYIILDLESMGPSIDAASVGKELDGVVVVLREYGCTHNQLSDCVSQMEYATATILGFAVLKKAKRIIQKKSVPTS